MVGINRTTRRTGLASWLASALLLGMAVGQEPAFIVPAQPEQSDPTVFNSHVPEPIEAPPALAGESRIMRVEAGTRCGNYGLLQRWWNTGSICAGPAPRIPARPFGVAVRGTLDAQNASGIAVQMVLFQYDFDDDQLNVRGHRQVLKISEYLRMVAAPVVIQPSGNVAIDTARRQQVVELLQQLIGLPDTVEAVVIDFPRTPGISGTESRIIHETLLRQVTNGGAQYLNSNINNVTTQQSPTVSGTTVNVNP